MYVVPHTLSTVLVPRHSLFCIEKVLEREVPGESGERGCAARQRSRRGPLGLPLHGCGTRGSAGRRRVRGGTSVGNCQRRSLRF